MKTKLAIIICLAVVSIFTASCSQKPGFDEKLDAIVNPYKFSVVGWEARALLNPSVSSARVDDIKDESDVVARYFSVAQQIKNLKSEIDRTPSSTALEDQLDSLEKQKAELADAAGYFVGKQIVDTLHEEGIYNPLENLLGARFNFPPLNFKLEEPPSLLVISPRDRIERIKDILLVPGIKLDDKIKIEAGVDSLNVSSLVVPLGGVATYPSFVVDEDGLRFALDAITEEWMHQYLTFRPLGFPYFLSSIGVSSKNYEVATLNETVASMASKEIGDIVYKKYYAKYSEAGKAVPMADFDFNKEMRETRKTVDEYLARGEVEKAEKFMEAKREYLAARGYYIRKINQAYFALYGTYADGPTSIDPIGAEMRELRNRSSSLKKFLNTASAITSRHDLEAALNSLKRAEK